MLKMPFDTFYSLILMSKYECQWLLFVVCVLSIVIGLMKGIWHFFIFISFCSRSLLPLFKKREMNIYRYIEMSNSYSFIKKSNRVCGKTNRFYAVCCEHYCFRFLHYYFAVCTHSLYITLAPLLLEIFFITFFEALLSYKEMGQYLKHVLGEMNVI